MGLLKSLKDYIAAKVEVEVEEMAENLEATADSLPKKAEVLTAKIEKKTEEIKSGKS